MPSYKEAMSAIRRNITKMKMPPDDVDRIFSGFSGAKKQRDQYRVSYQYTQSNGVEPSSIHIDGLPSDIATSMCKRYAVFGLKPDMIDTTQSLVACPENGSSKWNLFLNYIEYGDDAALRGYTATIFGACSGTGDLYKVFKKLQTINPRHPLCKYVDALKKTKRGDMSGIDGLAHVHGDPTKAKANWKAWTSNGRTHLDHIHGDLAQLPLSDEDWARAVWSVYDAEYWKSAADFCLKRKECKSRPGPVLKTPLALGFMVDTSLNHGPAWYWKEEATWQRIFSNMKHPDESDEAKWLADFVEARRQVLRSGFMGLDWSKTGDRCSIWKDLLTTRNWTLTRPIHIPSSKSDIWPRNLVLE